MDMKKDHKNIKGKASPEENQEPGELDFSN